MLFIEIDHARLPAYYAAEMTLTQHRRVLTSREGKGEHSKLEGLWEDRRDKRVGDCGDPNASDSTGETIQQWTMPVGCCFIFDRLDTP